MLVLHVVVHVCCTLCCMCVARWLHVFSQVLLRGDEIPLLAEGSRSPVWKLLGRRNTCQKEGRCEDICACLAIPTIVALSLFVSHSIVPCGDSARDLWLIKPSL